MSPRSAVFVLLGVASAVLFLSSSLFFDPQKVTAAGTDITVRGYAFSSTIGWIRFDQTRGNPVALNPNTNKLSGYGWSPNVGWVKFDPTLTGPNGDTGARVVTASGKTTIVGWARACSGMVESGKKLTDVNNSCANTGAGRTDGWDGWIHFDHNQIAYRPVVDTTKTPWLVSKFAWGANVLGWLDLTRVTLPSPVVTETPILQVVKSGGAGNVTSAPAGINCGSTCSSPYTKDVDVVLTASTEPTSWSQCDTVSANKLTCSVKMSASRTVTVVFPESGCTNPNGCEPGGNTLTVTCSANGNPAAQTVVKGALAVWSASPSGASNYTYIWGGSTPGAPNANSVTLNTTVTGTYNETIKVTSGADESPTVNCPPITVTDPTTEDFTPNFTLGGLSPGPVILIDCEHLINCANTANIQSGLLTLTNKGNRPINISFTVTTDPNLFYVVNESGQAITSISLAPLNTTGYTARIRVKMTNRVRGTEKSDQLTLTATDQEFPTYTLVKKATIRYLDLNQTPQ